MSFPEFNSFMTCLTFCCHLLSGMQFSIVFSPKLSNQALNRTRKTGYRKSENQNPGPSPEAAWNAWRFKIVYEQKGVFWSLFWVNNFFKMINLFAIFASEDGKQLLSCLYVAIFLFCAEKCPKDPEDTEVGELCGSTPPHPVRCPVYNWRFSHHSTPIHWLVYGRMTSNNETVSRQMP